MRAFVLSVNNYSSSFSSYPCLLFHPSISFTNPFFYPTKLTSFTTQCSFNYLICKFRPTLYCSGSDSALLDDDDGDLGSYDTDTDTDTDDDDGYISVGEESDENGIFIQIKKLGRNSRRIRSRISINAALDIIWNILTDYEKLADFIPGLAVSKLLEQKQNYARVYQIGQQNLPLGMKFNAKAVLDCFEKELETLGNGKKRDIEFKMTEGDFQFFEGKWSIEQVSKPRSEESNSSVGEEFETTLSYFVDVKPKLWLPVHLVEGRLCKEIQTNLSCIREQAHKMIHDNMHAQLTRPPS